MAEQCWVADVNLRGIGWIRVPGEFPTEWLAEGAAFRWAFTYDAIKISVYSLEPEDNAAKENTDG